MTEVERRDLYILRRHLGIEPTDAWFQRPSWEIDLLLEGIYAELGGSQPDDDVEGPDRMLEPSVPEALRGL